MFKAALFTIFQNCKHHKRPVAIVEIHASQLWFIPEISTLQEAEA
jgi:hypothetical protein